MLLDEPRVAESQTCFVIQFRRSAEFARVRTPAWAQEVGSSVLPGTTVWVGSLGTNSVVESILVPKDDVDDEDEAGAIADRIRERVDG